MTITRPWMYDLIRSSFKSNLIDHIIWKYYVVPSCQAVIRNLVYTYLLCTCVWIGVRTNYYVPSAAVITDIAHELGSTGCRHDTTAFSCVNTILLKKNSLSTVVSYSGPLYCA